MLVLIYVLAIKRPDLRSGQACRVAARFLFVCYFAASGFFIFCQRGCDDCHRVDFGCVAASDVVDRCVKAEKNRAVGFEITETLLILYPMLPELISGKMKVSA